METALTMPAHIFRCQGRTAYAVGQWVIAAECLQCKRRTADRPDGVQFLQPPKGFWCMARLDPNEGVVL
jgi:hypothetical protein